MLRFFLFLLFLIVNTTSIFAQKRKQTENFNSQKNTVYINYGISLTKTNFETEMKEWGGFVEELINDQRPNKPLLGHSFGISYTRWFNNKWAIGCFIRHSTKGQQSSDFLLSKVTEPGGGSGNYGGTRIVARLITNEVSLFYTKSIRNNSKYRLYWKTGLSVDVHSYFDVKDFLIERDNGIERVGCCTSFSNSKRSDHFNWFLSNFSNNNFRLGFLLATGIDWRLWKGLNLQLQPELEFLTKTISGQPKIASGTIALIGLQTGLSYNF